VALNKSEMTIGSEFDVLPSGSRHGVQRYFPYEFVIAVAIDALHSEGENISLNSPFYARIRLPRSASHLSATCFMSCNPLWLRVVLFTLLLVFACHDSALARRRRGRGQSSAAAAAARRKATIQQAQAQIAAANQVLAAAQFKGANAQGKLQETLSKLQTAASEQDRAHDTEASLRKELYEIEKEILSEQSSDTPYAKTLEELNTAKKQAAAAKAQIMARPDVIDELANLKGVALTNATNLRLETFLAYADPNLRAKTAAKELERIKLELFRADIDWKETHQALVDVQHDISIARSEAAAAGFSRAKPLGDYREASHAAAAARAAIAQAEGVLRSLNATASTSGSSKKKK
jgi:hypothetical protein